ncbi:TOM5 (YPR133W-A) [Zygosaccharomyces parabailii]|uniref:ZYBA0S08-03620g1_1 n=1 Tax=Zygosaccharomyces bailii (strain CLIB 213 / ATCC 58445 / CBS 680 / BCRC 21525 / NBRC 1098 / NCYC 1416 / NRRL Y-2227) TaxID=1333698 RepID=A0A8J2XCM7_ZYGB2|nr:TOM5 (YPR133W-A) [Zygosaccharomyces parabailii]AQZ14809.1 TOM5 (YPR133W-A) [Zygosaccharomyces parabailii]CDF90810.1 ZYBA0S08-03620g1_1 [Zygosaccharomyces bailii CLIB 213]SJM85417.1 uncharacterized protein ZBIST_2249 [Zygosaccharomyces bailii]
MFGLPQQEPSEEEKKLHQQATNRTVMNAVYGGAILWFAPLLLHFIRKQWK